MSALGHKQTFRSANVMSALPPAVQKQCLLRANSGHPHANNLRTRGLRYIKDVGSAFLLDAHPQAPRSPKLGLRLPVVAFPGLLAPHYRGGRHAGGRHANE